MVQPFGLAKKTMQQQKENLRTLKAQREKFTSFLVDVTAWISETSLDRLYLL